MKAIALFAAGLILAGCDLLMFVPVNPDDEIVKTSEEYGIPFVRDSYWISIAATSGDVLYEATQFIYGYPEATTEPDPSPLTSRISADIEVLAIFSERPESDGETILNSDACIWLWHNGMEGTNGLISFSQGRPVEGGVPNLSAEASLPFSAALFTSPVLGTDGTGTETVYVVAFYRSAKGDITHSTNYSQMTAPIAQ